MTDRDLEVLAWAAREIRDLDEIGRSMIVGFEPMSSWEMEQLKHLEKLAEGTEIDERDYEAEIADLEAEIETLEEILADVESAIR